MIHRPLANDAVFAVVDQAVRGDILVAVTDVAGNGDGDPTESDQAYQRCLTRMLKVATHETAHMFGIEHCTAYECGMNGSNNLEEADRGRLPFCPECSAKIWWSCGADPAKCYERLAEFGEKNWLNEEAKLWKKCAVAVGP